MTDYLYSLSLAQQTKGFLLSLGMGFILGILYDLIRVIRIGISQKRFIIIISDAVFCALACLGSFIFYLSVNEGEVRTYLIVGELVGFAVYYFSVGAFVFSVSDKVISFIKNFFRSIFKIFCIPFRWVFGKISKVFNKLLKKSQKNSKKIKNKSKILLKVNKLLLYNLFVKKQNSVDGNYFESEDK